MQLESYIIKLTIIHCHFPRFAYPWQDKPVKKACELEQSLLGFPKYLMLTPISMILMRMPFLFLFIISAGNRKWRDVLLSLPTMIALLPLIKRTKRGQELSTFISLIAVEFDPHWSATTVMGCYLSHISLHSAC